MNILNYIDIKLFKGRYKNLSLKVTDNGQLVVKAPKNLSNEKIQEFIVSKQKWINRQLDKVKEMCLKKEEYDFKSYVYLFSKEIEYSGKKEKFYAEAFEKYLSPIVERLSNKYKLYYKSLNLTNSKRAWGYLDNNKNMRLNWKILILPIQLCEYVITHELCHSKEFNHSKQFWSLVEKFLPNYKLLRKELKNYSFLLTNRVL